MFHRIHQTHSLRILHNRVTLSTMLLGTATMSSYSTNPNASTKYTIKPYTPRHASWPYKPRDFMRQDESPDTDFYSSPKLVTHIDDAAIESLSSYYDDVLPTKGKILDFCSSWISHYPKRVGDAVKSGEMEVWGMGMNGAELEKNEILGEGERQRIIRDLNISPDMDDALPKEVVFDASTCVVSIDYLSKPLEVLSSLRQKTVDGGTVHLAISNRAFWHKVVRRWMEVSEEERLEMVADYLWFAGWRDVEIVTVAPGGAKGGIMGMIGMSGDPLWVVRGRKTGE